MCSREVVVDSWHGCAARLSLDSEVGLVSGFLLSSLRLGNGTVVHRLTPSDEQPLPPLKVLSEQPAEFLMGGVSVVPVAGGRLVGRPGGSCAPAGFWIVS